MKKRALEPIAAARTSPRSVASPISRAANAVGNERVADHEEGSAQPEQAELRPLRTSRLLGTVGKRGIRQSTRPRVAPQAG
jgi:hypothetical protein